MQHGTQVSQEADKVQQPPGPLIEGRGNGLGLSIARGLVEAQQGKMSISSPVGKGAQVEIALPEAGG